MTEKFEVGDQVKIKWHPVHELPYLLRLTKVGKGTVSMVEFGPDITLGDPDEDRTGYYFVKIDCNQSHCLLPYHEVRVHADQLEIVDGTG